MVGNNTKELKRTSWGPALTCCD